MSQPMQDKNIPDALFAEFNRVQLGCITPNMRAISFAIGATHFTVDFHFSKAAGKQDEEAALDIMDALDSGGKTPHGLRLRHRFLRSDAELDSIGDVDGLTFLRWET